MVCGHCGGGGYDIDPMIIRTWVRILAEPLHQICKKQLPMRTLQIDHRVEMEIRMNKAQCLGGKVDRGSMKHLFEDKWQLLCEGYEHVHLKQHLANL